MLPPACALVGLALVASTTAQTVDLSWLRNNAAVGNTRRMTVDQGVTPGSFRAVGSTGASAMQLFLGTETTLYVVDKTERNDNLTIGGHPAWATEIDLTTWTIRPLDIITNSFCAGGSVSGNGSLVNVGGNNAITTSGADTNTTFNGVALGDAYKDLPGGKTIRVIDPCNDGNCNWYEWDVSTQNRWYPTLETLPNGTVAIIGGELYGGYTNLRIQAQNNPTVQVWPSGTALTMPFLTRTQPLNLYPITFVMPDGLVFANAGYDVIAWNPATMAETVLPNLPRAAAVYPASGVAAMLPMTPANNYTASVLICGGVEQPNTDAVWDNTRVNITAFQGSQSCSRMDYRGAASTWTADDDLIEGRIMGSLINLPDGTMLLLNGCSQGTAGYGWAPQWIGGQQGYGSNPLLTPLLYDPSKPAGSRWSRNGFQPSTIPRMYHSTAMLLPDGSVLTAGSNPNADFIGVTDAGVRVNATDRYWTTYTAEKWYPSYYSLPRPKPSGMPLQIGYGGSPFNVTLPGGSFNSSQQLSTAKLVLIRTGYSTHGLQMGQRHLELQSTITASQDGSAVLHVAGVPSPQTFPPGPALAFVVISGVPSIGQMVMIGSGQLGTQTVATVQQLPPSSGVIAADPVAGGKGSSTPGSTSGKSGASASAAISLGLGSAALLALLAGHF